MVTDLPVVNQLKPLLKMEKFEKFVVAYAPYPQVSTLRLVTDLPVVNQINPLLKVEKFEKFVAYAPCPHLVHTLSSVYLGEYRVRTETY